MEGFNPYSGAYDTLLGDSSVRLFGRPMWDIVLRKLDDGRVAPYGEDPSGAILPRLSENDFLVKQISSEEAQLARILAFSYQNQIFDLARPAIFLVHGLGSPVEFIKEGTKKVETTFLRRMPTYTDRSGVAGQTGSFGLSIRVWLYDRADFTVRLDSETGTFERVLLDVELGSVQSGSMGAGDGDEVPPPRPPRRRRWRGAGD